MKSILKLSRTLTLALAVATLVSAPIAMLAQKQGDGAAKLIQLKPVTTVEDLEKVEAGDLVVMSCPKCKDTYASVVEKSFKGATGDTLRTTKIHLCSSCDTKIVTKGQGKAAKDVLVHTCKTCGSEDVSCCVMKKGDVHTAGMHEKK